MHKFDNYEAYPFAVDFYDYVPSFAALGDTEFYLEEAARAEGAVLELGCGTGRILIPVAEQGSRITGLDASGLMLDVCRTKLRKLSASTQQRVTLAKASMHDFALDGQFDLVFSAFRSFQSLINVRDQLACLACVSAHLSNKGRLILDVYDPYLPFLIDESRTDEMATDGLFDVPDGRKVEMRHRNPAVDLTRQVMDCEMIYYVTHPDGRKERLVQSFPLRYFFRYEMEHLLWRAGFELVDLFGGYDRTPFGTKRPQEIIIVARKRR